MTKAELIKVLEELEDDMVIYYDEEEDGFDVTVIDGHDEDVKELLGALHEEGELVGYEDDYDFGYVLGGFEVAIHMEYAED